MSDKKQFLSRDEIIKTGTITEEHYIEELKKYVLIKVMSGEERRQFSAKVAENKEVDSNGAPILIMPVLIILCTMDLSWNPLFTFDDIGALDKLPSTITTKLFKHIAELNGLTAESIEEEVKN